ncbi:hypothetical protein [Tissierella sp.]|uniref:hypothetical protein n=1 Tax=Tissierella sp. TaxID=41274 RepID=UPI003056F6BB
MTTMKMMNSKKLKDNFLKNDVEITIYKDINPISQILIRAYFLNELKIIYLCNNTIFYKSYRDYLVKKFNYTDSKVRTLVEDLRYYNLITTSILYNKQVLKLNVNVINYLNNTSKLKATYSNRITNNGLYKSCYISYLLTNTSGVSKLKDKDYFIQKYQDYIEIYLFDFESSPINYRQLKELIEKDFLEYNFRFKITILTYSKERQEILNKLIKEDLYFRNGNFLGFKDIINTNLKKDFFTYSAQK